MLGEYFGLWDVLWIRGMGPQLLQRYLKSRPLVWRWFIVMRSYVHKDSEVGLILVMEFKGTPFYTTPIPKQSPDRP